MVEATTLSAVETVPGDKPSAVDAAARFVALQPGGAARILFEHDQRPDGTCGGCLTSPVTWPCVISLIATKAQELDRVRTP